MTLGASPYPSVSSIEKLLSLLRSGYRMECPPSCPIDIYLIMRECWNAEPEHRPTFSKLVDDIDRLLTHASVDYLDMGLPVQGGSSCSGGSFGGNSGETLVCGATLDNNNRGGFSSSSGASSASTASTGFRFPRSSSPIKYTQPSLLSYSNTGGATTTSSSHSYENTLNTPTPRPPSSIHLQYTPCGSDVTYTPLQSNYHDSGPGSTTSGYCGDQPIVHSDRPYVNQVNYVSNLQYCDHQPSPQQQKQLLQQLQEEHELQAPLAVGEGSVRSSLSMDEMTLDDFREQYSEHLQSSAL